MRSRRLAENGMSSKTSQAYRQIKVLIEAGHLGAGQRVTEARVAKLVGLTRGPVRESLLRFRGCWACSATSHTAWYSRQAVLDARTSAIRYILEAIRKNTQEAPR